MKANIGKVDKTVRIVLAVLLFLVAFLGTQDSVTQYILWIAGLIAILTSVISFCPLYRVLGMTTSKGEAGK